MIKKLKEKFNNIDKKVLKVMHIGFKCCLILSFTACFILLTYQYNLKSPDLYYSGLLLFKTSLFFFVDFIVCGFAVDIIRKEMV
ncbi:MAG: hypothetical protein IKT41_00810 [Clostridia bacterium]|nr:hypothetical protein [Clostridia bacterium]